MTVLVAPRVRKSEPLLPDPTTRHSRLHRAPNTMESDRAAWAQAIRAQVSHTSLSGTNSQLLHPGAGIMRSNKGFCGA
jgi:hypothetical protein